MLIVHIPFLETRILCICFCIPCMVGRLVVARRILPTQHSPCAPADEAVDGPDVGCGSYGHRRHHALSTPLEMAMFHWTSFSSPPAVLVHSRPGGRPPGPTTPLAARHSTPGLKPTHTTPLNLPGAPARYDMQRFRTHSHAAHHTPWPAFSARLHSRTVAAYIDSAPSPTACSFDSSRLFRAPMPAQPVIKEQLVQGV